MTVSLETLRRRAKALKSGFSGGMPDAVARVRAVLDVGSVLSHANALHVIAREEGYESWPKLKFALGKPDMDRDDKAERLKMALFHGQHWVSEALLREDPTLGAANFGLSCALYDVDRVRAVLARDTGVAGRIVGGRVPILHLTFSRHFQGGGSEADMLSVAEMLVAHGADVNASYPFEDGAEHRLSALYGAVGHSRNMTMARWLLEKGADPNDNESLYHSTELGHLEGLRMLLAHGARPEGTNALPRALDFDDYDAAKLLLEAGADPNDGVARHPSGEPQGLIPALHQSARRACSGQIADLLLDHGADPVALFDGHSAFALARVFGNQAVAEVLAARGGVTDLSPVEAQLARAADGTNGAQDWIDMHWVSGEFRRLLTRLVCRPGTLAHMQRLVAMGFDANLGDEMDMPPLHLAGWEGMPEEMGYFLSLKPDMAHLNAYGGTLFSTILHGSENCPHRVGRDHIGCMRMALEHGVALPRRALEVAAVPEMAALLDRWAAARPGQVVAEGVV